MNARQKKLCDAVAELIDIDDVEAREYYGVCGVDDKYNNIRDFLHLFKNVSDKIALAQWGNDYDLVDELYSQLELSEDEEKRLLKLSENNEEIKQTLNPELLSDKYDFLEDYIDFISSDINIQQKIVGLSDSMLEAFKQMYNKAKSETQYLVPIIDRVLYNIGFSPFRSMLKNDFYRDLNKSIEQYVSEGNSLTSEQIDKLLFLYTNKDWGYLVNNIDQLNDFENRDSEAQKEVDDLVNNERDKTVKDIKKIKDAILLSTYGIGYRSVYEMQTQYNVEGIQLTEENKDILLMTHALRKICNETDADKLIAIYDEIKEDIPVKHNYLRPMVYEGQMREMFAREINNSLFKPDENNKEEIDGVSVYNAGTDFNMVVTAVGAYQGKFNGKENYRDYWNSKKIRSHGNCCSLIANNNLSTAKIRNICIGFTDFDERMLLRSSNRDLNSTPNSREFNYASFDEKRFMLPNELINNTRGYYNELVYERRDLSANSESYKKNPSYIVFFEEFEDKSSLDMSDPQVIEILEQEKSQWEESVKAAKDFGIPIVKINRETCAKSEQEKINSALKSYLKTHDSALLSDIITNFENNRTGTKTPHDILQKKYFSDERLEEILQQVLQSIGQIQQKDLKDINIAELKKIVQREQRNFKLNNTMNKFKAGFDINAYLEQVNGLNELSIPESTDGR